MKKLFFIFVLLLSYSSVQAEEYKQDVHYKRIADQPVSSGDNVEVLEFFWFGCPHCYSFEPHLKGWLKNKPAGVEFARVPAIFRPEWILHARLYYALEIIGEDERIRNEVFKEMHNKRKKLDSIDSILSFVSRYGIDRSEFLDTMNSFAVESRIRKAQKMQKDYEISGVPAIAVNGKYLVTGSMAGSYEKMLKVMDFLIRKESEKAASKSMDAESASPKG